MVDMGKRKIDDSMSLTDEQVIRFVSRCDNHGQGTFPYSQQIHEELGCIFHYVGGNNDNRTLTWKGYSQNREVPLV